MDGLSGERGPEGKRGEQGMDGAPGPRGEDGPMGMKGERGDGHSAVFALHSFNSTVPTCPSSSHQLWEGYSIASKLTHSYLSTPGSCVRRFVMLITTRQLDVGMASRWYGASDVEFDGLGGQGESYFGRMVSRCSVCEVERTILTVHSISTRLPECPPKWQSFWSGFSFLSSAVSDFLMHQ